MKKEFRLNIDENGDIIEGKKDEFNLHFDQTNCIFDVQIRTMDKVVKEIKNKFGNSAIITVLGDALASPHFYSGSGLSSGKGEMGLDGRC